MSDEQFAAAIAAEPITAMDCPDAVRRMSDEQLSTCAPRLARIVFDPAGTLIPRLSDDALLACARAAALNAVWCQDAVDRLPVTALTDLTRLLPASCVEGSPAAARISNP